MANLPAEETGSDPSICILTSRNKKRIPIVPPSIAELRASVEMNVPHQIRPPETPEEMLTSDFASLNCTEPEIGYETSMQLECELGISTCCVPSGCSFDIQHNYNRSKSYRFCEMASYQERLRTFATWPLRSPLGRDLAAANMFYQGLICLLSKIHPPDTLSSEEVNSGLRSINIVLIWRNGHRLCRKKSVLLVCSKCYLL